MKFLPLILSVFMVAVTIAPLQAAQWPERPVTVIVPWGAGGNADIQARILCKAAEEFLGQPLVVVNKPGGGTIPGVTEALNAKPDGYTLVWIALPSVGTQPHLKKTPYKLEDVHPLANATQNSLVLYVRDDSPWYALQQFIDAAKVKALSMGLNGMGSLPHLAAVETAQKSGAQFKYIASESSASAVLQLLGGHLDSALGHEPQAFSHGKGLRALAVFEKERSPRLPLVPTAAEQGYDVAGYTRDGIAVSVKAPDDVKKRLEEVFAKAMATPALDANMRARSITPHYLNHTDTLKMWNEASAHYKQIIDKMR